jgi:DedD protein
VNDVLKQRLVGALILVALGVVFWPIIFVEPDSRSSDLDTRIPPRPDIETAPLSPPDRVGLRASPPLDATEELAQATAGDAAGEGAPLAAGEPDSPDAIAPEPAPTVPPPAVSTAGAEAPAPAARTRDEPPARPEIDAQGVPVAWMLQVISVSSRDKAEQTRQALQDLGHKAYIKPAQVEGKTVYRVYVGPKFERAAVDAIKGEVDAHFGVNSMVRRYLP